MRSALLVFFPSLFLISLFLLLFPSTPQSLVLRVPAGKAKCMTEDLPRAAMSVATYKLLPSGGPPSNVSVRVTSPDGDVVHKADSVESGRFSFQAEAAGRYSACFFTSHFALGEQVSVDLEWKIGTAATSRGYLDLHTNKQTVQGAEDELKKLEDSVNSIYEEMRFLREREEEGQKLYEDTNTKMGILSLCSLAICLGVSGLQLWHLKTFFQREKIL